MNIQNYSKANSSRHRKLKRRIIGLAAAAVIILAGAFAIGKLTENSAEYQLRASLVEENRVLREENDMLKEQITDLQNQIIEKDEYIGSIPTAAPTAEPLEEETEIPSEPPVQTGTTPRTQ
ncbi:MAG: hypothetical protein J1G06_10220 [Oscillospiraceae bacterium]|nr:hypothetical protein [Oscillospiraceae bacterium]